MKAIIICGMPASGKTTVAKIIAERLGLNLAGGGEVLKEMAVSEGYNPKGDDWWDTEEGISFIKERTKKSDFDEETDRRMMEMANAGNVVITSYTLPWLVKNTFNVWLDASAEKRIERMAKRTSMDRPELEAALKARDKENEELYEGLYKIRFGRDKKPFDLIIDTDNRTPEEVAEIVLNKINELGLEK